MLAAVAAGTQSHEHAAGGGCAFGPEVGVVVPLDFALPLPLLLLVGRLGHPGGCGGVCHPHEVEELSVPRKPVAALLLGAGVPDGCTGVPSTLELSPGRSIQG